MESTRFGKELREAIGGLSEFPFLAEIFNPHVLHHPLDAFWLLEVLEKVKKQGVHVREMIL